MTVSVDQLAVALTMLVPGFIATGIQRAFMPRRFSSDLHWTVSSLLLALVLNVAVLVPFVWIKYPEMMASPIRDIPATAQTIPLAQVLTYVFSVYGLSVGMGFFLGACQQLRLRSLLNRWGLVPYAQHPSVWDRIFEVRRPPDRPVTWLSIRLDERRSLLGHLRHSSEYIDKDQPFEIYLESPHEWEYGRWVPLETLGIRADGIYARIQTSQAVAFYFVTRDWKP